MCILKIGNLYKFVECEIVLFHHIYLCIQFNFQSFPPLFHPLSKKSGNTPSLSTELEAVELAKDFNRELLANPDKTGEVLDKVLHEL